MRIRQTVGIRELKNRLTYYLGEIKNGENVVITDRGNPVAIMHRLDSALVKRYVAESGSAKVAALIEGDHKIAVSWLAIPEILSAIARRAKGGSMRAEELAAIRDQISQDIQRFLMVEVAGAPVDGIETFIARHALRGADSIHLSTALWLGKAAKTTIIFVASDSELLNAARSDRLKTYNPAEDI